MGSLFALLEVVDIVGQFGDVLKTEGAELDAVGGAGLFHDLDGILFQKVIMGVSIR